MTCHVNPWARNERRSIAEYLADAETTKAIEKVFSVAAACLADNRSAIAPKYENHSLLGEASFDRL